MEMESLKILINKLYDMNRAGEECISLLQDALVYYNSEKFLDECEVKAKKIHRTEKTLTPEFIEEIGKGPGAKAYMLAPGHVERIGDYIENILGCMRTKTREGILFTDKAVSEMTFLFQRAYEVLNNTGDIILTRNTALSGCVKELEAEINKSANEFAALHEERLIKGLCMPKASSIFLDMLDAIKGIAWHAKEMAGKISSNGVAIKKTEYSLSRVIEEGLQ